MFQGQAHRGGRQSHPRLRAEQEGPPRAEEADRLRVAGPPPHARGPGPIHISLSIYICTYTYT